jgi:hypothetical protein
MTVTKKVKRAPERTAEKEAARITGPERQDYEQIEREYGPLPAGASMEEAARRYNLAVAAGIIREWKQQQKLENKK